MLVGYNSDNFDLPYIKERADTLNIKLPLGIDKSSIKFIKEDLIMQALYEVVYM